MDDQTERTGPREKAGSANALRSTVPHTTDSFLRVHQLRRRRRWSNALDRLLSDAAEVEFEPHPGDYWRDTGMTLGYDERDAIGRTE